VGVCQGEVDMGMYTEIFVNVDLKKDTPEEVINILKMMCDHDSKEEDWPEDLPPRWQYMFYGGSYYTPNTRCANLHKCGFSNQYSLIGKGDIKNYGSEIQEFFDFIRPHVDPCLGCEFIGYWRYEEDKEPTLVYL
jgi:hypothetical protein